MTNPVGRFEIAVTDIKEMRKFYTEVFDWALTSENPSKYSVIDAREGIPGLMFKADPGVPSFVTFYVDVDDVEKYLAKVEVSGGTVYIPAQPSPVPGEKVFAVFGDPEGNIVGLRERA